MITRANEDPGIATVTAAYSHLVEALELHACGKFLDAAAEYSAALALNPNDAGTWNRYGVTLTKVDKSNEAIEAFEQALAVDPSHADAARNLAGLRGAIEASRTQDRSGPNTVSAQEDPARPRIGLDWQIGTTSGWGVYGLNLALNTMRRREFAPVVFLDPVLPGATVEQRRALEDLSAINGRAQITLQSGGFCPFPTFHALGNALTGGPLTEQLRSTRRVGVVFFEDTHLDDAALVRGASYDRLVAGSTWNEELLKAKGLEQTRLVFQGIDTSVFHPAPRVSRSHGRFVVFSGGKLEYRKGQDLVVSAFAKFRQRHPDALLMVAWHNHWPQTMAEVATAGHVTDVPSIRSNGTLDLTGWLGRYGIPEDSVVDLGLVPNAQMADFVRDADVAVFPNRAEGGTNLVAMETLACGVPCILSENTGHLDLTSDEHNIVLHRQSACRPTKSYQGNDGWGESNVDEIIEALEFAYTQRTECLRRAANAAAIMANAAWHFQIDRLFAAVGDVLA